MAFLSLEKGITWMIFAKSRVSFQFSQPEILGELKKGGLSLGSDESKPPGLGSMSSKVAESEIAIDSGGK